ncbi:hypothetical protein KKF61_08220 [Patescibacteria group bacterium]|nr:hypothetical protein [Patescibacteria group bacterium]
MSDDGEWVIVRYYPSSEIDLDNVNTRLFELETGMHIIREGWFKGFEHIDENMITYEIIHSMKDWKIKHMLDDKDIQEEMEIVEKYL